MTTHRVSDPERIRALAHPTRLDLLDYLRDVGEATATECAEHVGESVASCSFHLRILGKYGYIERAERRGREKPWRPVNGDRWDMRSSVDVPGSRSAAVELGALTVLREGERFRRYLAQTDRETPEWVYAAAVTTSAFWATAEEMAQLNREIHAMMARLPAGDVEPSRRPPGARRSRLFVTVNPEPNDA